jgi:hypothetical protein
MQLGKEKLLGKVGLEFWLNKFGGGSFMFTVAEAAKNSFDWGASQFNLITNESRDRLRLIDDGCGMNRRNREAFISVGMSTAGGREQSGTFGSGINYLIYSFASYARIVTAPEEEPDRVYVFEITPQILSKMYAGQGSIQADIFKKDPESWPHPHPFGTDITITFRDPGSSSISRGDALAKKLSDRLDLVMGSAVFVNGNPLPKKQVVGQIFQLELPEGERPGVGRIRLEFYRPQKPNADQKLRLTGRTFGEVSIDTFFELLRPDQQERMPELFLRREVCGLITAAFLNDYVMEQRNTYQASIADDERVTELLRILQQVEADVAAKLQLSLRSTSEGLPKGEEVIRALFSDLQKVYPVEDQEIFPPHQEIFPPHGDEFPELIREKDAPSPRVTAGPYIRLNQEEYELGENIVATLVVPEGSADHFHWYLDDSKGEELQRQPESVTLKASRLGNGGIQAKNLMTGLVALAAYQVVEQRVFRLSASCLTVLLSSKTSVHALNVDRLAGPVKWQLTKGSGELKVSPRGKTATFIPSGLGSARIVASDSLNPEVTAECEIRVTYRLNTEEIIQIRDEKFRPDTLPSRRSGQGKPVTINAPAGKGKGSVHNLHINPLAPGYQEALQAGNLREMLIQAIALEYVCVLDIEMPEEVNGTDLPLIFSEVQNRTYELYREITGSK